MNEISNPVRDEFPPIMQNSLHVHNIVHSVPSQKRFNLDLDSRQLQKLSIFCFSRNRLNELIKLYSYYSQLPVQLIILEGSDEIHSKSIASKLEGIFVYEIRHPDFNYCFVSAESLPERSLIAVSLIEREYCVNVGDDDFVSPSALVDSVTLLDNLSSQYVGTSKSRNASKNYISRICERMKTRNLEIVELDQRLTKIQKSGFTDVPWMSVLRTGVVKNALNLAGKSTLPIWRDDRFSANLWSSTYVAAVLCQGAIVSNRKCIFYKRSFDVEPDESFQIMFAQDYGEAIEVKLKRKWEAIEIWLPTVKYLSRALTKIEMPKIEIQSEVDLLSTFLMNQNFNQEKYASNKFRIKRIYLRLKGKIQYIFRNLSKSPLIRLGVQRVSGRIGIRPTLSDLICLKWRTWKIHGLIHNCPSCQEAYEYFAK